MLGNPETCEICGGNIKTKPSDYQSLVSDDGYVMCISCYLSNPFIACTGYCCKSKVWGELSPDTIWNMEDCFRT